VKNLIAACSLIMLVLTGLTLETRAAETDAKVVKSPAPKTLVRILENGLTVILAERHTAPVCNLQVWVRCGSLTEGKLTGAGISHYVEHMLFKGTKKRSLGQMDRDIRRAGGNHNAYTSLEQTVYHVTLPSRNLHIALDCLADAVMNSAFDAEECVKEKEVIIKEINRGRDNPGWAFYYSISQLRHQRDPRRHPVIGYRNIFEKITREQLVAYYQKHYIPNNMFVVAVGDFDAEKTFKQIGEAFKDFQRKEYLPISIPRDPPQASPRSMTVRNGLFQEARVMLSWQTVAMSSPEMYPLDMAAAVLGQGRTSRLHRRLVEKEQVALSVSASNHTPSVPGYFSISARCQEKNVEKVIALMEEELAKLISGGIEKTELQRVKSRLAASEIFQRESVRGLASSLGHDFFSTGNINFSRHYRKRMDKVQAPEVVTALKKYILPFTRSRMVGLPAKDPTAKPVKEGGPGNKTAHGQIIHKTLPGGCRLLIYPRSADPIVAISAVFLGGLRYEDPQLSGLSNMMAKLLTRGTKKFSSEQLAEIVADSGGSLHGYGGRNSFGVSAKFLARDLELGLKLTAEVLSNPTFPKEQLEKMRVQSLAGIKRRKERLWTVNDMLLDSSLYQKHPYSQRSMGNAKSVSKIKQTDLVEFHRRFCRSANMVLCVAGDVTVNEVLKLIEKHFSQLLRPRKDLFAAPQVSSPTAITGIIRRSQGMANINQAMVMLGFRGPDLNNDDRFALQGLKVVLSGMGSRLFVELRGKQSLAYAVGCYNDFGLQTGGVIFYIGTKPEQVPQALAAFQKEIATIRNTLVSDEELQRAKNSMLGHQIRRRQSISSIAQGLAYKELYGLQAESYFGENEKIEALTKEDLQAAAKRYLDPKNYVLAITRPFTKEEKKAAKTGETK
jgi:zinc protease